MKLNLFAVSTLTVLLLLIVSNVFGCFITNCPPGGKRSSNLSPYSKPCMRCGPGQVGQCFGPNICCGPGIGCQLNNAISRTCQQENQSRSACRVQGSSCASGQGTCASDSLCCTTDACFEDKSCSSNASQLNLNSFLLSI